MASLQAFGAHDVGQAVGSGATNAMSHFSPKLACLKWSPQSGEQLMSFSDVQPTGQHISSYASEHSVTSVTAHRALQSSALPATCALRHLEGVSGQLVGQAPKAPSLIFESHASPRSTTPLPHRAGQSASTAWLSLNVPSAFFRQQPSPDTGCVIGTCAHAAWQPNPVT
jgi:hypothetical protein